MQKIKIKNMVCKRCILTVKDTVEKLSLDYRTISLGIIDLAYPIDKQKQLQLSEELGKIGFIVMDQKNRSVVDEINKAIRIYIELSSDCKRANLSAFIAAHLHYNYSYLSMLYSTAEGKTIEQTFQECRIDKAKEMLSNTTYTLNEIADYLGYGSIQYLSNQFKRLTGMSPSIFKKINE